MSDPGRREGSPSEDDWAKVELAKEPVPPTALSPDGKADPSVSAPAGTSKELTADEQMALYEKELKENDWGHQSC
jgi:hypothetical protein